MEWFLFLVLFSVNGSGFVDVVFQFIFEVEYMGISMGVKRRVKWYLTVADGVLTI